MAFFSRSFILLWQGQLVSQLGNQAFLVATTYFTLEGTGSATLVGLVMMASTAPIAILGPIGGTVADRHSRRAILVVTDLLRALVVGALGFFILWQPDFTTHHLVLLIAIAGFSGVMSALFMPALQAMIPDLEPGDRLASANSVSQISSQTSILIGQALGGILYAKWGAAALLLFDAVSFAYGAVATSFIPPDQKAQRAKLTMRGAINQYAVETREGISYISRRRGMTAALVMFAGVNFLFMPVFVLLPLYTRDVLNRGPEWYGFLLAGSGTGALIGSSVGALLLARIRARDRLMGICVLGIACCVLIVATTRESWVALAAFIALGALSAVVNVTVITTFQLAVATEVRGRVMALVIALSTAIVPLGMGLGGVMGDLWRGSLPLVFASSGIAIAILITLCLRMPGLHDVFEPVKLSVDGGTGEGR